MLNKVTIEKIDEVAKKAEALLEGDFVDPKQARNLEQELDEILSSIEDKKFFKRLS